MEGLDARHEGLTRLVSEAIMASRELLQIVTGVFAKSGVLRLLAVRVWLHAVCAALFLLKTTLANTPLPSPSNDDVRLLNRIAITPQTIFIWQIVMPRFWKR